MTDERSPGLLTRLCQAIFRGLDLVTPARAVLLISIFALIVVHGLFPGDFKVDAITVSLVVVMVLCVLVPILESATFPGGGGFKLKKELDDLLTKTAEVSQDAGTSDRNRTKQAADALGTANAEATDALIDNILQEAARSPRVALMVLSADLERAVRRLVLATGWTEGNAARSLGAGIRRLVQAGVLTQSAASALELFTKVRNEIVHGGQNVSDDEILRALDAGLPLLKAVLAVPYERHVVREHGVDVFSDPEALVLIPDAKGVILESVSPAGIKNVRIFPTTRTDYEVGRQVSWEWGTGDLTWTDAWYRDRETGEVRLAWNGSVEFIGRHID